jgi:hypothetical protein
LPQYAEGETAPDHQIWAIGGLLAIPIWSVKGQVARCTEFARYCRIADVAWVHAYALVGMFTRRLRADWKAPATNRHFSIVIRIQARRSPHIGHAQIGPLWGNSHLAGPTFLGLVGARSHKGGSAWRAPDIALHRGDVLAAGGLGGRVLAAGGAWPEEAAHGSLAIL